MTLVLRVKPKDTPRPEATRTSRCASESARVPGSRQYNTNSSHLRRHQACAKPIATHACVYTAAAIRCCHGARNGENAHVVGKHTRYTYALVVLQRRPLGTPSYYELHSCTACPKLWRHCDVACRDFQLVEVHVAGAHTAPIENIQQRTKRERCQSTAATWPPNQRSWIKCRLPGWHHNCLTCRRPPVHAP